MSQSAFFITNAPEKNRTEKKSLTVEIEKKRLEMVAMQAQLATLKQQIASHFTLNYYNLCKIKTESLSYFLDFATFDAR